MLRRILYVLRVLRLIALMLGGALFGYGIGSGPTSGPMYLLAERQCQGALTGMFCGLALEITIRTFNHDSPSPELSHRSFLIVVCYTLLWLGIIAYALRR